MELMIGISLFAIALFGVLMVLGESMALGKLSGNRTAAVNETRRVVEEIRRLADANGLASVVGRDWTAWAAQNLGNTLSNQNTTVTNLQGGALPLNTDPLPVRVTVSWTERGKSTVYRVDTLVTSR